MKTTEELIADAEQQLRQHKNWPTTEELIAKAESELTAKTPPAPETFPTGPAVVPAPRPTDVAVSSDTQIPSVSVSEDGRSVTSRGGVWRPLEAGVVPGQRTPTATVQAEPLVIKPVGANIKASPRALGAQVAAGTQQYLGALLQAQATRSLIPATGAEPESTLDPEQQALYKAGEAAFAKEQRKEPLSTTEQNALMFYKGRRLAKDLQRWVEPIAKHTQKIADYLIDELPDETRMSLEDAQLWLSPDNPDLHRPSKAHKTAAAALIVAANSAPYAMTATTSLLGPVGKLVSHATMAEAEKGNWIQQARKLGIDDPEVLDKFGTTYGVFSGLVEQKAQEVLLAPVKGILEGKEIGIAKALAGKAGKRAIAKIIAEETGKWLGSGVFEGVEEVTQQQLQDWLLASAFKEMSARYPERAQEMQEAAQAWAKNKPNTLQALFTGTAAGLVTGGVTRGVANVASAGRTAVEPLFREPTAAQKARAIPAEQYLTELQKRDSAQQEQTPEAERPTVRMPTIEKAEESAAPQNATKQQETAQEGQKEEGGAPSIPPVEQTSQKDQKTAPHTPPPGAPPSPLPEGSQTGGRRLATRRTVKTIAERIAQAWKDLGPNATEEQRAEVAAKIGGQNEVTGLPGKAEWNSAIDEARQSGKQMAYIYMDIDRYKWFNDNFSHDFGDDVLRQIMPAVNEAFMAKGIRHFHLSGDENGAIAEANQELFTKLNKLKDEMEQLFIELPDGREVPLSMTMAVSSSPKQADELLSWAKEVVGRNGMAVDNVFKKQYNVEDRKGPDVLPAYLSTGLTKGLRGEQLQAADLRGQDNRGEVAGPGVSAEEAQTGDAGQGTATTTAPTAGTTVSGTHPTGTGEDVRGEPGRGIDSVAEGTGEETSAEEKSPAVEKLSERQIQELVQRFAQKTVSSGKRGPRKLISLLDTLASYLHPEELSGLVETFQRKVDDYIKALHEYEDSYTKDVDTEAGHLSDDEQKRRAGWLAMRIREVIRQNAQNKKESAQLWKDWYNGRPLPERIQNALVREIDQLNIDSTAEGEPLIPPDYNLGEKHANIDSIRTFILDKLTNREILNYERGYKLREGKRQQNVEREKLQAEDEIPFHRRETVTVEEKPSVAAEGRPEQIQNRTERKLIIAVTRAIRSNFAVPDVTIADIHKAEMPDTASMHNVNDALAAIGYKILPVQLSSRIQDKVHFNAVVVPHIDKKTVVWNVDGRQDVPVIVTAFHEIGHQNRELLDKFLKVASEELSERGVLYGLRRHKGGDIPVEVALDYLGYECQKTSFWQSVYRRAPDVVREIIQRLTDILNKMLGKVKNPGDEWFRSVRRVRRAAEEAMAAVLRESSSQQKTEALSAQDVDVIFQARDDYVATAQRRSAMPSPEDDSFVRWSEMQPLPAVLYRGNDVKRPTTLILISDKTPRDEIEAPGHPYRATVFLRKEDGSLSPAYHEVYRTKAEAFRDWEDANYDYRGEVFFQARDLDVGQPKMPSEEKTSIPTETAKLQESDRSKPEQQLQDAKKTQSANKRADIIEMLAAEGGDIKRAADVVDNAPAFVRKRGLASNLGAVGGQKQLTITRGENPSRGALIASKVQAMFDRQRSALKDKLGFNTDKFIDTWLSRLVDVGAPWKRRICRNMDGRQVVQASDMMHGASGEAMRLWELAEKDIYGELKHNEEFLFADYLQAMRTIEVEELMDRRRQEAAGGQKIEEPVPSIKNPEGYNANDMREWIKALQEQHPESFERIHRAATKYWDTMRQMIDALLREGLITNDQHAALVRDHKYYSPRQFIQHFDEVRPSLDLRGRVIQVMDSGLKELEHGSEEALVNNPRMLLANVIARTQGRIFRNRANTALYRFVERNPDNALDARIVVKESEPLPTGQYRIYCMIDGQRHAIQLPTEIAVSWLNSDPKIDAELGKVLNVMLGGAILRPMATGYNPAFAIANLPRDLFHAWFVETEYSPILPVAWAQMFSDFRRVQKDVFLRKGIVARYIKDGGSMDFLTSQGALFGRKPWEAVGQYDEAIQQINKSAGYIGETSELWTRMALKYRAEKNGKSSKEASWIARRYIDFALGGSWTKAADKAVPYLNAAIQGTRGLFRSFQENPAIACFKAAQVTALGVSLALWNRYVNRKAWESISDREKAQRWIITTPLCYLDKNGDMRYIYFGIPKDQGQQLFATIGELAAEAASGIKVNLERLAMAASNLFPIGETSIFPPVIAAYLAYAYNMDIWTRRQVWEGRSPLSPSEEWTNETPQAWVLWGKATGLSPERSRRAFHKIVPQNIYTLLLETPINIMTSTLTDREKHVIHQPYIAMIKKIEGLNRIVRETLPQGKHYEGLLEKANNLMLETNHEDGSPLGYVELKRAVEQAERARNDKRIALDRKFDMLVIRARLSPSEGEQDLKEALANLRQEDEQEYKRVLARINRLTAEPPTVKYEAIVTNERPTAEQRIEFLKWYKTLSPAERRQFEHRVQSETTIRGFNVQRQIKEIRDYFKPERERERIRNIERDLRDGRITEQEYARKLREIKEFSEKFADIDK